MNAVENHWWVYIVECADGSLYTGVAKDMVRRLNEHNHSDKGAKYTRNRRPVRLVWLMPEVNRSSAQKRECLIKKLTKQQKNTLITADAAQTQCHADSLEWG